MNPLLCWNGSDFISSGVGESPLSAGLSGVAGEREPLRLALWPTRRRATARPWGFGNDS